MITVSMSNTDQILITPVFAQAYSEGNYSENIYNGGKSSSAGLSDTGTAIILIITVGAILVFGAIITRVLRRSSRKSNRKY